MNESEEDLILIINEEIDNSIEVIEQKEKFINYLTNRIERLQQEKELLIKKLKQQEISLTSRKI